jgi:Mg2+-importing ATPase
MLLGASLISIFSGDYVSAILIVAIIIISSVINFVVSRKSEKAVEALAAKITLSARVIRDGVEQDILVSKIVPGDIVILEAGKVIPADGVIHSGSDLYANESSLTGESVPVEKNIGAQVFMGSGVVTGRAYMQVTQTGPKTKFYSIVALLATAERPGEFERGITQFSYLITKIVLSMTIFVFLINAVFKHDLLQSLIFALALAVGLTPEMLPMIIATNIAKASLQMSGKGVIVKKLSSVENFGSMDILCTDKTGTLTEDHITLVKYIDIGGADSPDVLEHAYITSAFHTGTKTPLDSAISEFRNFDLGEYSKVDEIPFDFERRRDSMIVDHAGARTLIVKGSPESVFTISNLSASDAEKSSALFESLSADGYRVIAVASKLLSFESHTYKISDECDLDFLGFIAFIDPPKPDVKEVLAELEEKGINIKIITGDHPLVAQKIAKEVGLPSDVLTSQEIDQLTDEELGLRAEMTTIFARVTPVQKNRIITVLQNRNHVVGYMGDGINDAPALHTADVGISVDNAVDVAKEAADIILLSKSFRQLIDGVVEGRRTFANTIKYITMAVSSNFGNMFSMTGASLFLPFLPMLPVQILLNNLLYESSQMALTFDNVEQDILKKPNPWNIAFIKKFMLVFGTLSSVFDFLTFYVLYKVFMLSGAAFQTGWFIESFATQVLVIFIIRSNKPFFKAIRPHGAVILSALVAVGIAWTIALTPIGVIIGFSALTAKVIMYISAIVAAYLISVEFVKNLFFQKLGL